MAWFPIAIPSLVICCTIVSSFAADIVLNEDVPTNATFYFQKDDPYSSVTEMKIGDKVHFKLGIHFPVGTLDISVELFTPDNETTFMVVCDPKVTFRGSNIVLPNAVTPVLDAKDKTKNYDRAVLNFGNVENTGADVTVANNSLIIIEWDAVMIDANRPDINGSVLWISAGAEYNNENNIWVAQASFIALLDDYIPTSCVSVNASGPDSMEIGSSATFKIDMFIPYPCTILTLNVFSPLNETGVMSTCGMAVTGLGKNFQCVPKDKLSHTSTADSSGKSNSMSSLSLGQVCNTGARDETAYEDSIITVQFIMIMLDVPESVGKSLWVGATLEVGTNKIWAGELQVDPVAKTTVNNVTSQPSFTLTNQGASTLASGSATKVTLDIEPGTGTEGDYELEILMPFNDTARFHICGVKLVSIGTNMPCYISSEPVLLSRDPNTNATKDRATWHIGKLGNHGIKSTESDTTANKATIEFTVVLLNHSLNTEGEQLWLTAGVKYSEEELWVVQTAITINDSLASGMADAVPTFNMAYKFGTENVHVGTAMTFVITMTIPPGTSFNPFNIEFLAPYANNSAVFSICKVELVSIGENLPCIDHTASNSSINLTSSEAGDSKMTLGSVTLASVCNVGQYGENATEKDNLVFEATVRVEDHVTLQNGTLEWFSVGTVFSATRIWVGQTSLIAIRDDTIDTVKNPNGTVYSGLENDTLTLAAGSMFSSNLMVKIPAQSTHQLLVAVDQNTCGSASICNLRLAEAGVNLPCTDLTLEANVTWGSDGSMGINSIIDAKYLTNIDLNEAIAENGTFDNNSVRFELVGQIQPTASVGSCTLKWTVTVDGTSTELTQTIDITATNTNIDASNLTIPAFSFYVAPLGDDNSTDFNASIAVGESALFRLDITPVDYAVNYLQVKILTPLSTSDMEICAMSLVHTGRNIPCMRRGSINGTIDSRLGSTRNEIGTLELGYVCSYPLATDEISKKITVEAVARLLPNASVTAGDTLKMNAAVKINQNFIYVTELDFTVADGFTDNIVNASALTVPASIVLPNTTDSVVIGSIYNMSYSVTITPNMSHSVALDAAMPISGSACMTVESLRVTGYGVNLGCPSMTEPLTHNLTYISTNDTTQMDTAYINLGIITNAGPTYRTERVLEEDNQLVVEAVMRMADCVTNDENTNLWISFGAKVGGQIVIAEKLLIVTRTGEERPEIGLSGSIIGTSQAAEGDLLQVESCIRHLDTSSAELIDAEALYFLPPQLEFSEVLDTNGTKHTTSPLNSNTGIIIKWSNLFFTDIFCFNLTFILLSNGTNATAPSGSGLTAVPFQASGSMYPRSNSIYAQNATFYSVIRHVNVTLNLPCGKVCDAQPLNSQIKDCQLSGSTSISSSNVKDIKETGSTYWLPGTRCSGFARYVEVDFLNKTTVTRVRLEQSSDVTNAKVTSYQILYSEDGLNWESGEVVPIAGGAVSDHNMACPVESRYFRLSVVSTDSVTEKPIAIRSEFYGCPTQDLTAVDTCSVQDAWNINTPSVGILGDWLSRPFLAVGNAAYVCDINPNRKSFGSPEGQIYCFKASGCATNSWEELEEGVGNIIGYDAKDTLLVGISRDKRTYLVSQDEGTSFYSISSSMVTDIKASGQYTAAVDVAWTVTSAFNRANTVPQAPYEFTGPPKWGATFDGVYCDSGSGWTKVADWCYV